MAVFQIYPLSEKATFETQNKFFDILYRLFFNKQNRLQSVYFLRFNVSGDFQSQFQNNKD